MRLLGAFGLLIVVGSVMFPVIQGNQVALIGIGFLLAGCLNELIGIKEALRQNSQKPPGG